MSKTLRLCLHNECGPDAVAFGTNRQITGLSIEGAVGGKGWLRLYFPSNAYTTRLQLYIPFELFPCPLGFFPSPSEGKVSSFSTHDVQIRENRIYNEKTLNIELERNHAYDVIRIELMLSHLHCNPIF